MTDQDQQITRAQDMIYHAEKLAVQLVERMGFVAHEPRYEVKSKVRVWQPVYALRLRMRAPGSHWDSTETVYDIAYGDDPLPLAVQMHLTAAGLPRNVSVELGSRLDEFTSSTVTGALLESTGRFVIDW